MRTKGLHWRLGAIADASTINVRAISHQYKHAQNLELRQQTLDRKNVQ